ncbi:MAG: lipase family alpha/beta hydrolase [Verrucomicrobiales bacterium]
MIHRLVLIISKKLSTWREVAPCADGRALFALVVATVLLASCAVPQATVYRPVPKLLTGGTSDVDLHRMLTRAIDPEDAEADRMLGRFVEEWHQRRLGSERVLKPGQPGGLALVVHLSGSNSCYPVEYFDTLEAVSDLKVARIPRHRREGVGAPMVALRENLRQEPIEHYYPPEAITRSVTAFAIAGPIRNGERTVEIRLHCPLSNDTVDTPAGPQPLAADFSAPWAALLARTGDFRLRGFLDAVTPRPSRPPRLYLMQAYDPEKEPLIMIHGLYGTPLIWAKLSNELWADPDVRNRYQIWHYYYNTSAPALYSARLLREQLREVRQLLDPTGRNPAMQRTTLLAHSMGGLISKALVVRPGDAYWKAAFVVPHDTLKLSPADRASLHEAFEWEPVRSVHRIIYMSVPHRGSDYADNLVGQIGRRLTDPPQSFRSFYERISQANPGVFTPAYEELGRGRLNSVSSLSPSQPTLQILADLPYAHPVKIHSIIGTRGRRGPLEESSDGIVPYTSSHLPDPDSELLVPSNHWSYNHPDSITEIKRILKERP